jgi:uracil-DNA glycosylase family 4
LKKNKIKELIKLKNQYSSCKKCPLYKTRNQIVFGRGAFNKRILIVGEAPGPDEDLAGNPFIGRAGKTLIKEGFRYIGFERNDSFIMNSVLCYPGRNETGFNKPEEEQILACRKRFRRTIEILNPIIILALGNSALFALCNKQGIMENKDNYLKYKIGKKEIPVIATYHPSAVNRDKTRLVYFKQSWKAIKEVCDAAKAF